MGLIRRDFGVSRACWVATLVAIALAARPAWGHSFPTVRTVVVQVEPCELTLLVGYRPGSGEPTEGLLARVASQPKSRALDAMRDLLTTTAMAPLTVSLDGARLVPTAVRAKLGLEPGGARPMVVVLVTYALPAGHALAIASTDRRTTQISWQDQDSHRVVLRDAPAQGEWYVGVASFLLSLASPSGGSPCVASTGSSSGSSAR
jgi:hypothetical protein